MFGNSGEVVEFLRIRSVIVKFRSILSAIPLRVPPALGADAVSGDVAALDLGKRGTVPFRGSVVEQRTETCALQTFGRNDAGKIGE